PGHRSRLVLKPEILVAIERRSKSKDLCLENQCGHIPLQPENKSPIDIGRQPPVWWPNRKSARMSNCQNAKVDFRHGRREALRSVLLATTVLLTAIDLDVWAQQAISAQEQRGIDLDIAE